MSVSWGETEGAPWCEYLNVVKEKDSRYATSISQQICKNTFPLLWLNLQKPLLIVEAMIFFPILGKTFYKNFLKVHLHTVYEKERKDKKKNAFSKVATGAFLVYSG